MSDLLLDSQLAALVDDHERQLRSKYPRLANYLDLIYTPLKLRAGGWLVYDTIYATEPDATEAHRAVVMLELTRVDRSIYT